MKMSLTQLLNLPGVIGEDSKQKNINLIYESRAENSSFPPLQ